MTELSEEGSTTPNTESEPTEPESTAETQSNNPTMTRRDFLGLGAKIAALGIGIPASVAIGKTIAEALVQPGNGSQPTSPETPTPSPTEQPHSPEIPSSQVEFGFNTHVHALLNGEADNMTLEAFKGDVDRLVQANQKWIRFNFINNGVVQGNADGSVGFSDKIGVYDEAIDYARQRGLKIALVTNAPESFANLPIDQYVQSAANFYLELAKRYKGKIETWQLFNEADTHNFRDYHDISAGFEATYLDDLVKVVAASASAIKSQDPNAKITMNASLWAPDRSIIRDRTTRFFDPLASSLDIISLDPYPDVYDPNSAQTIPEDIEYFYNKYKKDIAIAEIGVSAHDIPDNQKRANILLSQLSTIKSGRIKPKAVFPYEMRNEEAIKTQDPREAAFGTQDFIQQLTEQMQPPQGQSSTAQATT